MKVNPYPSTNTTVADKDKFLADLDNLIKHCDSQEFHANTTEDKLKWMDKRIKIHKMKAEFIVQYAAVTE